MRDPACWISIFRKKSVQNKAMANENTAPVNVNMAAARAKLAARMAGGAKGKGGSKTSTKKSDAQVSAEIQPPWLKRDDGYNPNPPLMTLPVVDRLLRRERQRSGRQRAKASSPAKAWTRNAFPSRIAALAIRPLILIVVWGWVSHPSLILMNITFSLL